MVQAEAILIDDETEPVVQALEARSARLAVVSDDGPVLVLDQGTGLSAVISERTLRLLRQALYVPLDHAAVIIGTAPVALRRLIRRGDLAPVTRGDQTYVSLGSALDYRDRQEARRGDALDEMLRVSEEGGLYDAERELS